MDGILVIRKEKGYTSHDVVAKLRGILHMKKIGHTGTLDPAAEGVLPVALGRGTRLVELLTEKEKTYEAVLRLGVSTDTQDMTGTILSEKPVTVTEEEVRETVASFVGEQMQVPPMYSALKVGGKKLYELAREGKTIERKPRPVVFYEIRILDMDLPLVRISVTCSKGTYIRTLCNDIGEKLGCGGAMEELLRTRSGNFTLEESMALSQVEEAVADGTIGEKIVSIEDVLSMYPHLPVHRKETDFLVMEIRFRKNWYRAATGKKKSGCIKAAETSQEYTAGMRENRNMFPSACSLYRFFYKNLQEQIWNT